MPALKDFEGQIITLILPNPNRQGGLQREAVKLLTVEDSGIWVENQTLTNETLQALQLPATEQVAAFFYPYEILVSIPGTSLSEKAFGI